MATPPGGGVPPPRPPTLEEIVKIFRVAKNFTMTQDFPGDKINVRFTVSKEDCEAEDIKLHTFGSQFLGELWQHLDKLAHFEDLTRRFTDERQDPMNPGKATTAADLIAFLNNELRYLDPVGLEGTMRRRMYTTIIQKLMELQEWRAFADRKKFDEARARARAEKERQAEMKRRAEEAIRQAQEEIRRHQEEAMKAKSEKSGKTGGNPFGDNPFGDNPFRSAFDGAFSNAGPDPRSSFRYEDLERMWKEFRRHGGSFHRGDSGFYGGPGTEQPQPGRRRTQDKVRPTGKWYEILGVPLNADKATIKSAWRKLCKVNHPDRGGTNEKMAEINAAKDEGLAGAAS